jgi:FHS family glucose/mannose:H+ symporter-like MFS transporter
MPARTAAPRFESLPASPFYIGLVVAGIVTVLSGPILPVLSARWSLTDLQAGFLFTAQFTASTLGAVLASHFPRHCVTLGYASIGAGVATLALGNYPAALMAFVLIGVGIGGSVTATNLIFGTAYPEQRGALLAWVNFFWGVGAVSCPQLVAIAERTGTLRIFLAGLSLSALAVAVSFTPMLRSKAAEERVEQAPEQVPERLDLPIFVLFSVLLFLYIGAETSIAGWVATYTHRFFSLTPARSSLVVSAFWLSIVLGRAAVSPLVRFISELKVLIASPVAAALGLSLLLSPHSRTVALAAVVLAGVGCAPIFPLSVARLLARIGRSRHSGWIFAICGFGGAVIPWLTGLVSAHTGSLRTAFIVPLAAVGGIFLLILVEKSIPAPPPATRETHFVLK